MPRGRAWSASVAFSWAAGEGNAIHRDARAGLDALGRVARAQAQATELPFAASEMAHRFRELCRDLSLARDRNYSSPLVDRLQQRVLRVQQRIYWRAAAQAYGGVGLLPLGIPALVRREWRFVAAAAS
jgi:hypothetical protein